MTTLGIDLDDLGLGGLAKPVHSAATAAPTPATDPDALTPGSPLAQVLYQVWNGRSVTSVESPPGAGKSTLICQAIAQLHRRSDMKITLATPTRRGAFELADRLGEVLGLASNGDPLVRIGMSVKTGETHSKKVSSNAAQSTTSVERQVLVRTIASCAASAPECDVLIVDEAYQAVFAQVALAADKATQVLLVGDPGQIGPVVQTDTAAWEQMAQAPHMRAPEVFSQDPDAFVVRLPCTYRVGQDTVEAIAALYDFPFQSQRPDRHVTDRAGKVLPELASMQVPATDGEFDLGILDTVAAAAESFIGATLTEATPDGPVTRPLTGADVAVVVARSGQESAVLALLARMGNHTAGVTVGTADRLQGGQWHAVVALDPLTGTDQVDDFRTGPGRLCVMASRHMAHLLWVHDGRWEHTLTNGTADPDAAKKGLAVRRALTATTRSRRRAAA